MTQKILLSTALIAVWLLAAIQSRADTITLPLELDSNGHLRVPVLMEDGATYDFILDTAASRTGLMQPLVEALGLKPDVDSAGVLNGTTGAAQITLYAPTTMMIGGVLEYRSPPLPGLGSLNIPGEPFYGILGTDFFEHYVVEIDAIGKQLVLSTANHLSSKEMEAFSIVPIRPMDEGLWMLDARIGGVVLPAILDTGARNTMLNPAGAEALGVQLPASFEQGQEKISGATGHSARGIGLQVGSLSVGDRQWSSATVLVSDLHVFSMLGLSRAPALILASDLLFQGRLLIDYEAGELYLEKPR